MKYARCRITHHSGTGITSEAVKRLTKTFLINIGDSKLDAGGAETAEILLSNMKKSSK